MTLVFQEKRFELKLSPDTPERQGEGFEFSLRCLFVFLQLMDPLPHMLLYSYRSAVGFKYFILSHYMFFYLL